MLLTLSIPDELYAKYAEMDEKEPRRAILRQLDKMQDSPPVQRTLLLTPEHIKQLDELLGDINTPDELVRKVGAAVSIRVGETDISLTRGQLARVASAAAFYKRTPSDLVSEKVGQYFRATWGS